MVSAQPQKKVYLEPSLGVALTQVIVDAGIQASHTPVFDNHLRGAESAELGVALNDGIGLRAGLLGLGEHRNLSAHLGEFERT